MGQSLTEGQRDLIQCDRKKRRLDKWSEEQTGDILNFLLHSASSSLGRQTGKLKRARHTSLFSEDKTDWDQLDVYTRSFPDRMRSHQNKLLINLIAGEALGKAICPSISLKAIDPLLKGTLFPIAIVQNSTPTSYFSLSYLFDSIGKVS